MGLFHFYGFKLIVQCFLFKVLIFANHLQNYASLISVQIRPKQFFLRNGYFKTVIQANLLNSVGRNLASFAACGTSLVYFICNRAVCFFFDLGKYQGRFGRAMVCILARP